MQGSEERQLGRMWLSAIAWCVFAFGALDGAARSLVWRLAPAAIDPASAWTAAYDLSHPLSGVYFGAILLFGAGLLYLHMRAAGVTNAALPAGQVSALLGMWIAAGVVIDRHLWYVIAGATAATGGEHLLEEKAGYGYDISLAHIPGEFLWSAVGAPVFEEMAFRGLMLGCLLARGWNPVMAVTVTAAVFAATHQQYQLPALIYVFAGGLFFGWLRMVSGGLLAPIAAHSASNAWIVMDDWAAAG